MQPAMDAEVVGVAVKQEPEEIVAEADGDEEGEAEKVVVKRRRKKKKTTCDPHKKRACVDCTKRCARIHGRPASPSALPSSSNARPVPAVPSFFKVMMGYFSEGMVCFLFPLDYLHLSHCMSALFINGYILCMFAYS